LSRLTRARRGGDPGEIREDLPLTSTAAPFTARDFDRRLGSGRKDTRERASSEKAGAPVLFSWRGTRRGSV
jgi:hypothetical protein